MSSDWKLLHFRASQFPVSSFRASWDQHKTMLLRTFLIGFSSCALVVACTGCELIPERFSSLADSIDTDKPPVVVDGFEDLLHSDRWVQSRTWSMFQEDEDLADSTGNATRLRWGHPDAAELQRRLRMVSAADESDVADDDVASDEVQEPDGGDERPKADGNEGDGERPAEGRTTKPQFAALAAQPDIHGWNAAILWAQQDPHGASAIAPTLEMLTCTVPKYMTHPEPEKAKLGSKTPAVAPQRVSISSRMRAAAAEAWCLVLADSDVDPEQAMAPAGNALLQPDLPAEVRGELWRGIARRIAPNRIAGVADALEPPRTDVAGSSAAREVRRAAIEACLLHAVCHRARLSLSPGSTPGRTLVGRADDSEGSEDIVAAADEDTWPPTLWELRSDPEPFVRKRYGEILAVLGHPEAFERLKSQLSDQELIVKEAAYASLGILGSAAAIAELKALCLKTEDRTRMLAVRGLAWHGVEGLLPMTQDESVPVRGEVARGLARHPRGESAQALRRLLSDRSLDVQLAAAEGLTTWPDKLALPLLLHALAESSYKTRKEALDQLRNRRGERLAFPYDGDPQVRARRVAELAAAWQLHDAALENVRELASESSPRFDALRAAELRDRLAAILVRDGAADPADEQWFQSLTAADVPFLEQALPTLETPSSEYLFHRVLPRLSEAYAAAVELQSGDVTVRRKAARVLAQKGSEASLSPLLMGRVANTLRLEQDQLVWRFVMQAIQKESDDSAGRLALLAINSSWPDVRVLGCQYVGYHGLGAQATWILPLFSDTSRQVQLAAVTAAGACRNPIVLDGLKGADGSPPLKGLRSLLNEPPGPLRLAAVISMSQIGDPQAVQELVRMSYVEDAATRAVVVQSMGNMQQARFIEPLIRLAWTEADQLVKQEAVHSLEKLVRPADRPTGLDSAQTLKRTVDLWVAWWEDRRTAQSSGTSDATGGSVGTAVNAAPAEQIPASAAPALQSPRETVHERLTRQLRD